MLRRIALVSWGLALLTITQGCPSSERHPGAPPVDAGGGDSEDNDAAIAAEAGAGGRASQAGSGGAPAAVSGNSIELQSDLGDYIGAGRRFSYSDANASISVSSSNGVIEVMVTGDESWTGNFAGPSADSELMVGRYTDLTRWPFHDPSKGGLSWSGEGRGCNMLSGSFEIIAITYDNGMLHELNLQFEQHCEGSSAALHGKIHWSTDARTVPNGPQNPPPTGLWRPASGALPASGRYVYLRSDPGDYIGGGKTQTYTQQDAVLSLQSTGGHLSVRVAGDENWTGDFIAMQALDHLEPGYYGDLQRYPFHNPVKGGLSWSGDGRGCNTLSGWFVVDEITYVDDVVASLELRFEQHCEGMSAALHGMVHWTAEDSTASVGPINPPPANLWKPAEGVTPANPRYVYLESSAGDFIGAGATHAYTQANATLTLSASGGVIHMSVKGDEDWTGDFAAAMGTEQLSPGYYSDLSRYPFQNPVKGGLDWSGEGRGCNTLSGWFAIDNVTYTANTLNTLDLRFEQHCEGGSSSLHGKIHWSATDSTVPPGPVNPAPADLWSPLAGATPANGNYVYLQSDVGDYIGQAQTTSTPLDASALSGSGASLSVSVAGWSGQFVGMLGLARLQPGYYGGLARAPFHNPVKGGLSWSGQGRGCNTLSGWFAIDAIAYTNDTLTTLDLRFEQHCEMGSAALHGKIHLAP